jgi:hypothetical protein
MRYLLTYFLVLCFAMILGLSIVALILGTFWWDGSLDGACINPLGFIEL